MEAREAPRIEWTPAGERIPDADQTVLVHCAEVEEGYEVWLGYYDGMTWRMVEGFPVDVRHWAPLPQAPEARP